jgi:hypothetical protein
MSATIGKTINAFDTIKSAISRDALSHMEDSLRYNIFPKAIVENKKPNLYIDISDKYKPFKHLGKMLKKYKDTVECRHWDFNIAHLDMLSIDDLIKTLSRENPIVFVTSGTPSEKNVITKKVTEKNDVVVKTVKYIKKDDEMIVFVHSSIVRKADLVNMPIPNWLKATNDVSIFTGICKTEYMNNITTWAKKVKRATWGKINQHKHIRVIIPKI